jgi:protein O-mannosyl-transferase
MNNEAEVSPLATAAQSRFHFPTLRRWNLDGVETAMLAGILSLTTLVYLRCLANGFVSDDVVMILHNQPITRWSYLWISLGRDLWWFNHPDHPSPTSFYQPIQSIWLGLGFHLFGKNPLGWHLAKIILHLCATLLVFRMAQLLSHRNRVAIITVLLFALLPVHAEPVVWATDIPEPLSTVFELAALSLFIQRPKDRYWRGLVAPLLLYAAAAFTHESAVVFPALVAAYVFIFEIDQPAMSATSDQIKPSSLRTRLVAAAKWTAPFVGVAILYLCVRALVLGASGIFGFLAATKTAALVQSKVVIRSLVVPHSVIEILLTLPSVLIWYLGLLLFPWLAGPAHDAHFVAAPTLTNFYMPAAALAALVIIAYLLLRRSPHARLYLFCAIWWLITTAPAPLPGIRIGVDLIYDRYQYLPSFAFCLLLADLAVRFARESKRRRNAMTAAIAALAAIYMVALWQVEPVWHDNVAMFSRCVAEVPGSAHYHQVLGGVLAESGNLETGTRELAYASKLSPDDYTMHYQLAALYMRSNRCDDAKKELAAFYRTVFAQKSAPQTITLPPIIFAPNPSTSTPTPLAKH